MDFREIFRNSGKNLAKFRKNLAKSRKNSKNCEKNDENFAIVWRKNWDSKTVQRSALCRSRRELSNAYLLAKFGFDTAENEPPKVWGGRVLSARHSVKQEYFHKKMLRYVSRKMFSVILHRRYVQGGRSLDYKLLFGIVLWRWRLQKKD